MRSVADGDTQGGVGTAAALSMARSSSPGFTYEPVCELDSLHTNSYVKAVARKNTASAPPPPPPPPTTREFGKQETREALLRAGMEMFAEQGLDAPSLDALCARAGFTRGAFYVHFK